MKNYVNCRSGPIPQAASSVPLHTRTPLFLPPPPTATRAWAPRRLQSSRRCCEVRIPSRSSTFRLRTSSPHTPQNPAPSVVRAHSSAPRTQNPDISQLRVFHWLVLWSTGPLGVGGGEETLAILLIGRSWSSFPRIAAGTQRLPDRPGRGRRDRRRPAQQHVSALAAPLVCVPHCVAHCLHGDGSSKEAEGYGREGRCAT